MDYVDHHDDEKAEKGDERVSVEEGAAWIKIIKEEYTVAKYDSPDRYFEWRKVDQMKVRADDIERLVNQLSDIDTEHLLNSLRQIKEIDEALSRTDKQPQ